MHPLIQKNRETIKQLAFRRGAFNVRLFGSMADDCAGLDSDVDILVDMQPDQSALALGALLMDLQDLLGRKVDLVTEKALHPIIRDRVLQQAIPL